MFNFKLLGIISMVVVTVYAFVHWHNSAIRKHPILAVAFEHKDHQSTQCIDCHHNYVDDTGHDSCYSCHKHDQSVALEIEKMFHDFCRDCHLTEARKGLVSGPFRVCVECHNESGRLASHGGLLKK